MEDVIHYLELKNQYYVKFCAITEKFLEQARENKWDELEFVVDNRERILNIIRSFDFKISALFDQEDLDDTRLQHYQPKVKALLDERARLADKIVALDLELISRLDEYKSDTIRELKRTVETGQQMESFDEPSAPITKLKEV